MQSKLALQRKVKDLEADRTKKRRALYEAQDDIDSRKESLFAAVEAKLQQKIEHDEILTIRWKIA